MVQVPPDQARTVQNSKITQVRELAIRLEALSQSQTNPGLQNTLAMASQWLFKLSSYGMCGSGTIGCHGGHGCTSDHK